MTTPQMFVVTQVSPYVDGPAGVHGVLVQAAAALSEIAEIAGLHPVVVPDVTGLDAGALAGGGVLCLFTIGETPWSAEQRTAVTEAVRAGRLAVLGIHSATDSCRNWPEFGSLLGARFDGHPWTTEFAMEVVDASHPSTAHLESPWRWKDEVYLFRELRPDANVVLRVAEGSLDMEVPGARVPECGFPLAWYFNEGRGCAFYTSLGHFPHAWEYPVYLRHVAGGLSWLLETTPPAG
jgi:uncharacterized protein